MPEYNFQLKGWHAILAIIALVAFAGVKVALRVRTVDDEMRDAVRQSLLNEYSGRGMRDLARLAAEARSGLPVESLPPFVQRDIQFKSIGAHGAIGGSVTFVRAEITVDGGPPPDGRPLRYLTISHKFDGGWMVIGESDSYRYYRELFP